jgi:hypothetical protein
VVGGCGVRLRSLVTGFSNEFRVLLRMQRQIADGKLPATKYLKLY